MIDIIVGTALVSGALFFVMGANVGYSKGLSDSDNDNV